MLTLTDGMLLYHGSFTQVSQIDLDKCKAGKDFGRGFYVTSSYKQAQNFVPLSVNKQVKEGKLPALFSFILPVLMVNPVLNRQTASPSHCCYQIVWKTNSVFATEKSSSLSNS